MPPPPPPQPPPQPGWQQPPAGYWQPQQPWQQPGPQEPDNGPAVAGFVLSMIAAGLMVLSLLLLSFVCVVLAILGIVYSRRGKRKVEAGETRKHRGLAQAGYVTGLVTLVIAVPVTILEIVFLIAYASDEEFREDIQDDWDQEFNNSGLALRLAAPILRELARLFT
jgi:hypothetical protein